MGTREVGDLIAKLVSCQQPVQGARANFQLPGHLADR
jgi:hypothetical protein